MAEERKQLILRNLQTQALANVRGFENSTLATTQKNKEIKHTVFMPYCNFKEMTDVYFSKDDKYVLFNTNNNILFLNIETGKIDREVKLTHPFGPFTVSQDEKLVFGYERNNMYLRCWDFESGQLKYTISTPRDGRANDNYKVQISPDGKYLVFSGSKTIVYEMNTGELLSEISANCKDSAISTNLKYLAYAHYEKITIFDFLSGLKIIEHRIPREYHDYSGNPVFSQDGKTLFFTFGRQRKIVVFDFRRGEILAEIPNSFNEQEYVNLLKIDPSGKNLFICTNQNLSIIDIEIGQPVFQSNISCSEVEFDHSGKMFATINSSELVVWDAKEYRRLLHFKNPLESISQLELSSEDKQLFVKTDDKIREWNNEKATDGIFYTSLGKIEHYTTSLSGKVHIFNDSQQKALVIISANSERNQYQIPLSGLVLHLSISNDEKLFVYSIKETNFLKETWLILRDVNNGQMIKEIKIDFSFTDIKISQDNRYILISSSYSEKIYYLNIETGSVEKEIVIKNRQDFVKVNSIQISSNDQYCLTSCPTYAHLTLWDLGRNEIIKEFIGYENNCFSPDIKTFYSRYLGKVDLKTGQQIVKHNINSNDFMKISSDTKRMFTINKKGKVNIYDYDTGDLLGAFFNLNDGFLWTTAPDDFARDGWMYTNRPDLVTIAEGDPDAPDKLVSLCDTDDRVQEYLKMYNDREMTMNRIFNPERYQDMLNERLNIKTQTYKQLCNSREEKTIKLLDRPECEM